MITRVGTVVVVPITIVVLVLVTEKRMCNVGFSK